MKRYPLPAVVAALTLLSGCSTGTTYNPPFGGTPVPSSRNVTVTPNTLSFTTLTPQSVVVFQSNLTPSYTESDNCSGVATIAFSGISNGSATYTVTPTGAGGCTATFTGLGGHSGTLTVSSTPYGAVTPNPSSFSFLGTGPTYTQSFSVTQTNFTGTYTESDDCTGIATVTQNSDSGGNASYSVEPTGVGMCQITITGGSGKTAIVGVTVTTTNFGIDSRRRTK